MMTKEWSKSKAVKCFYLSRPLLSHRLKWFDKHTAVSSPEGTGPEVAITVRYEIFLES